LLLSYYEGDKLVYAGRVGTGFDTETLRRLSRELSAIERRQPPVDVNDVPGSGVHWVEPRLVAQCAFTEWTHDGKLRHPRFLGLRRDKDPREVVRERA
jgi:ATP-dependent DNA ligase